MDSVLSSHEADFWGGADLPNETLSKYRGTWSLGELVDDSVAHGETKRKCFDFGPVCATQLLTSVPATQRNRVGKGCKEQWTGSLWQSVRTL